MNFGGHIVSGLAADVPVELVVLTKSLIESIITYREAIDAVDEAYKACGSGQAIQPQKEPMYTDAPSNNNVCLAMPAYLKNLGIAGVKWGCDYYNQQPGIPTIWGVIIVLNNPKNGLPLAIMDGTAITNIRTAGHAAIAAKYLAKKDSQTIAMIGAGAEARTHLAAFRELFPLKMAKVYDIKPEAMDVYKQEMSEQFKEVHIVQATTAQEAVKGADIVCMVTTAMKPVVFEPWIEPGCLVTGIHGFYDLDPVLSQKADKWVLGNKESDGHLFIDDMRGQLTMRISREQVYADMGEIAAGIKPGRENDEERIVYTHAGMGVHDLAVAYVVYKKALEQGLGTRLRLI